MSWLTGRKLFLFGLNKLVFSDLRPEDNNYYACKAQSGDLNGILTSSSSSAADSGVGGVGGGSGGASWVAYAPPPEEALGRLSVWFAPPSAGPPPTAALGGGSSDGVDKTSAAAGSSGGGAVMYGLAHKPSRLECRALGQPPPQWTWTGPATRKAIAPTSAGQTVEADGWVGEADLYSSALIYHNSLVSSSSLADSGVDGVGGGTSGTRWVAYAPPPVEADLYPSALICHKSLAASTINWISAMGPDGVLAGSWPRESITMRRLRKIRESTTEIHSNLNKIS